MSDATDSADALPEDDEQLFEVLDRYLNHLHEGDINSRSQLLIRHPELADLLGTLESLESLAIPATPTEPPSGYDPDAPTMMLSSGSVAPEKEPNPPSSIFGPDAHKGQTLGNYELQEEVGRGGMGVVFKARQISLDRQVALKMILSSHLASEEELRRFQAEAKAAGGLRHANIVSVHETGQIHGLHYITMDYVDGVSLAQQLQQGPMTPTEAAELLLPVACAVHYLHTQKLVHRDLKPSNILIDKDDGPQVTDFGLAKIFGDEAERTHTGTIIGTPSYMAPEQAAGKTRDVTACSDVYSLGAILYEMLTGRPPFKEENPLDTLVQVLEGEPERPSKVMPHIPKELEWICLRCLEKDPERRYPSAEALAADLERFLKRDPVEAQPAGPIEKIRRWSRREPALVSRLSGLALAMLIVQGTYLMYDADWTYHKQVSIIFMTWALTSVICQKLLRWKEIADCVRFSWAALDAFWLTMLLAIAREPIGCLLIGYPVLITACGLFFRVSLVMFMTGVSMLCVVYLKYARPDAFGEPQYPVIFAAVLFVQGFIVAYQVYRVKVLSRYYNHRQM